MNAFTTRHLSSPATTAPPGPAAGLLVTMQNLDREAGTFQGIRDGKTAYLTIHHRHASRRPQRTHAGRVRGFAYD